MSFASLPGSNRRLRQRRCNGSSQNLSDLLLSGLVKKVQMQGALKRQKLGSYEERKIGVN